MPPASLSTTAVMKPGPMTAEEDGDVIAERAQHATCRSSLCLSTEMMSSAVITPVQLALFIHHRQA